MEKTEMRKKALELANEVLGIARLAINLPDSKTVASENLTITDLCGQDVGLVNFVSCEDSDILVNVRAMTDDFSIRFFIGEKNFKWFNNLCVFEVNMEFNESPSFVKEVEFEVRENINTGDRQIINLKFSRGKYTGLICLNTDWDVYYLNIYTELIIDTEHEKGRFFAEFGKALRQNDDEPKCTSQKVQVYGDFWGYKLSSLGKVLKFPGDISTAIIDCSRVCEYDKLRNHIPELRTLWLNNVPLKSQELHYRHEGDSSVTFDQLANYMCGQFPEARIVTSNIRELLTPHGLPIFDNLIKFCYGDQASAVMELIGIDGTQASKSLETDKTLLPIFPKLDV